MNEIPAELKEQIDGHLSRGEELPAVMLLRARGWDIGRIKSAIAERVRERFPDRFETLGLIEEEPPSAGPVRAVFGLLALLFGVGAMLMLPHIPGWTLLAGALTCAVQAIFYRPSAVLSCAVSPLRLLGIFAACVILPLVVLLVFFDQPGWRQPLIVLFLLCSSMGPPILLRRYAQKRKS